MILTPLLSADIAELILAAAGHVIAARISLHHHPALFALPVAKGALKELEFILLALPFMFV
jgi:hypothetical protein